MLLVSTCGTSLLTNMLSAAERGEITRLANKKEDDLSGDEKRALDRLAAARKTELLEAPLERARDMSAEINGIAAVYGGRLPQGAADRQIFLQTDTCMGRLSTALLTAWAERNRLPAECRAFSGLNTASLESFRPAMAEIARWCSEDLAPQRGRRNRVVFNLTGGFKSVQGFMQALGMFYADEVVYIFEGSAELLRIPRLPLAIESSTMDTIGRHVPLFRKMALNIQVTKKECGDIPETLLDAYEPDRYVLSPWGEIFWQRFREEHYGRAFITEPPLPERIRFEESFLDDVRRFENDAQKLTELNERIDDLARYLVNGNCLKRLNFKKLEGKPAPGCTHEFYAWSTGGAWRCFCAVEEAKDGTLCRIKKLGEHL